MINPDDTWLQKIKAIDEYFISLSRPKNMDGNSHLNAVIQQKKTFERVCIALMQNGINSPDELTVIRFFSAIEYYEKRKD